MDSDKYLFGWETIQNQFLRDKKRIKVGSTKATKLSETAVTPNKYDKMAVEPAKQVFDKKSINEHFINISKRLGCY